MHRYRSFVASFAAAALTLACDQPAPASVKDAVLTRDAQTPHRATEARSTAAQSAKPACPPTPDFGEQFVEAAQRIRPSVVSISSSGSANRESRSSGVGDVSLSLLARAIPIQPAASQPRGLGSGVVVDDKGTILTNHHIVEGTETVRVQFADGSETAGRVTGTDPRTDLAVVVVSADTASLHAAALGDSDKLRSGEWVIACGSPFGGRQTITAGILSAVGRGSAGIADYEDFIQTDAAVDASNSGGALVDRGGLLIGINTAMGSRGDGSSGPGFAIPINMARKVMAELIDRGKVVRGNIGTYVGYVTDELAVSFGFGGKGGALVQDVGPESAGERAGLAPGDIIVERDGKPVESATAFRSAIAGSVPGTTTRLKVFRRGKSRSVDVQIAELPAIAAADPAGGTGQLVWGLEFADISAELRDRLRVNTTKGAVIVQVNPNSPADDGGLRAGDIVAAVGDSEVIDADQARRLLLTAKAPVRLRILHDGRGAFVILQRGK